MKKKKILGSIGAVAILILLSFSSIVMSEADVGEEGTTIEELMLEYPETEYPELYDVPCPCENEDNGLFYPIQYIGTSGIFIWCIIFFAPFYMLLEYMRPMLDPDEYYEIKHEIDEGYDECLQGQMTEQDITALCSVFEESFTL